MIAAATAAVLVQLAAGAASAQETGPLDKERAREHFARGKELFAAGEYRGAIGEFAAADKLATSPLLEFNIALCHERLGERAEALRRYRLYLDRAPQAPNRGAVEEKVARLEKELEADEAARQRPRAGGAGPPGPPDGAQPPEGAGPPTGDGELDRAARIDIGRLRSERRAGPPNRGARSATTPTPGATLPRAPSAPPPRDKGGERREAKPIYKEWWFWVVTGVAAAIVVYIATSDSDSSDDNRARLLPSGDGPRSLGEASGAVLLRF